jgi:hypothetical protein
MDTLWLSSYHRIRVHMNKLPSEDAALFRHAPKNSIPTNLSFGKSQHSPHWF